MDVTVKEKFRDEHLSAAAKEVRWKSHSFETPNRFLTTAERSAKRRIKHEGLLESELTVHAKLVYPDTLSRILREEDAFKRFVRQISSRKGVEEAGKSVEALHLVFKGSAEVVEADRLKTILDAQLLAGLDFITVQQCGSCSPQDFLTSLSYAERWASERSVENPIIPVMRPQGTRETAAELLNALLDRGFTAIGLDLNGSFPYQTLRAVEDVQRRRPVWVHAFQAPPKVRFGEVRGNCALGMILQLFGVDSFTRWVVPPPPEPLTMDKINVFDKAGWGYLKKNELIELRRGEMGCDCPICGGRDVNSFFQGKVLEALSKGKLHDHYSQREELKAARERIKKDTLAEYLRSKEYPRSVLPKLGKLLK